MRDLATVVVAPLEPAANGKFADRLNPLVDLDGISYALVVQEIVAIRKTMLGHAKGSAEDRRQSIIGALDLLLTGI